jgi:hypothetical protein
MEALTAETAPQALWLPIHGQTSQYVHWRHLAGHAGTLPRQRAGESTRQSSWMREFIVL